jgi:hypothetical protein
MSGLSINDPIDFKWAISSPKVIPGDTLLLRGGTYKGDWTVGIKGIAGKPVTIRPYDGEQVVIDGSMNVDAPYVEIYDIDFTDSRTDRTEKGTTPGISAPQPGFGLFGCTVSNLHSSGVYWFNSGEGAICENIILNNGYREANGEGVAHGVYTHNHAGGARQIARNLFYDQFGKYCFQIYSGGNNYLRDYTVEDNIICGDAAHTGGGLGLKDFIYRRNIQWYDYCQQGRYAFDHGWNENGQILDNVFIDLYGYSVNADCSYKWINLTESGNVVYGGEPKSRAGYEVRERPATFVRVIPFSKSSRWLAGVAIYNRDNAKTVPVDFKDTITPGKYKLRNSQNPAETWDFEYTSGVVDVPTTWTAQARIGDRENTPAWPVFGGLVVEK